MAISLTPGQSGLERHLKSDAIVIFDLDQQK